MLPGTGKYIFILIASISLLAMVWVDDNEAKRLNELANVKDKGVVLEKSSFLAQFNEATDPRNFINDETVKNVKNRVVEVVTSALRDKIKNGIYSSKDSGNYLELIASISPPQIKDLKLQASDIDIYHEHENNNTRVYISFNTQGEMMKGALQVLKISPRKKKRGAPRSKRKEPNVDIVVEQTLIFNDTDIHSLRREGKNLFLVGATSDPQFKTPSVLEIFSLHQGIIPHDHSSRLDLPSFAATSVISLKEGIYVSVGDKEGGIVRVTNKKRLPLGYSHYKDIDHDFMALEDPRDLTYSKSHIFSITGTGANLWVKDRKQNLRHEPAVMVPFEGANLREAKASIEVSKDYIFLGLGDGGTRIVDKYTYEALGTIPQMYIVGLDQQLSVTNSVHVSEDEIYTADGEGGSRVFKIMGSGDLVQIASIRFGKKVSVNAIKKLGENIIFATGLGGVKVARLVKK